MSWKTWIIVRKIGADSTSISDPELTVTRGKTRLESDPDAVDDHNFYCALLCSTCSTTCCGIAVWTVESNHDFVRSICRNSLSLSGLGISRQTGFSLAFPSPTWIACQGKELHPPFL